MKFSMKHMRMGWGRKDKWRFSCCATLLCGVVGLKAGLKPELCKWLQKTAQSVPPGSEEISTLIAYKQVALEGAILSATAAKCAPSLEVSGFQH